MCLILFAYKAHPKYKLIVAANRDEFYDRPTETAHWWNDEETILGGKDLKENGSWFAINKLGRFAALTNYRDPFNIKENVPSRGALVTGFLKNNNNDLSFSDYLVENGKQFNGFNIIYGDPDELCYYSNYQGKPTTLKPGIYGLSNALLDAPWPKVAQGKKDLVNLIAGKDFSIEASFDFLNNSEIAPDEKLPDTGVGMEKERMLSPLFIKNTNYGTRCSTILLVDNDDEVTFVERSYVPKKETDQSYQFRLNNR
ncbi:NRDE family protein [Fulvivirgaceae bacterium BMA10]|uniref:NRDE family protein n=1 Tax=Splendidivirga corallicola TaxID=3051826 RepID=A0ABT8KZD5_9BACT|nr:NRDE family protein [Fulvivirgaceae bacterium BMA10]